MFLKPNSETNGRLGGIQGDCGQIYTFALEASVLV
jgi:hypothetical protein